MNMDKEQERATYALSSVPPVVRGRDVAGVHPMTVPNLADCKDAFQWRPPVERYYCTCGAVFEGISQADVKRQQFEHRLTVSTSPADENNHEGVAW